MHDLKPFGSLLWAVLLVVAATFGFNGCGNVNDVVVPNNAPVANAGPDLGSIISGTVITLNGSASTDPNGDPLTYSWTLLTKPAGSAAVLANPTSVTPTFTVDLAGDYTAQLIVNDGTVDSAPDSVIITSSNVAPVANAGPDQGGIALGSLVTLDGSASSDANGDPLTYSWSLTAKPAGSAAVLSSLTSVSPTFIVDLAGTYVVQLIVNDGTVSSAPNTVNISTVNVTPVRITTDKLREGRRNRFYVDTLEASGGIIPYTWSVTPVLPAGLTLAPKTGVISGTPTATSNRDHNFTVRDSINQTTTKELKLRIR